MVIVVQRVLSASVSRKGNPQSASAIGRGFALLVGVASDDDEATLRRLAAEVAKVRLMEDAHGRMGLSLADAGGEVLAVSQFTLLADFSKGNRPSFHKAAKSDVARPVFDRFVSLLSEATGRTVRTGFFGEDMELSLVNDGPVTVVLY
ncbi:MAG: D-aminoacyl-tRNA deacylase [Verrucomicrobiota bacterium]